MIKQYKENMNLILDLVSKILNLKPKDKISFKLLNETFDSEIEVSSYKEDKLLLKIDEICKKNTKYYYPAGLLLFFRESFEYIFKYEDRFQEIKSKLEKTKDLYGVVNHLKDDMWPFQPFFQEALVLFAVLVDPDEFSVAMNPDFVMEELVRQNAFYDEDGDVVPFELQLFLLKIDDFFNYTFEQIKALKDSKDLTFHQACEIKNILNQRFKIFNLGFMGRYQSLYNFALMQYDKVNDILKEASLNIFDKELKATYKHIKDNVDKYEFKIKTIKKLDELDKMNDLVNDLYNLSAERYNEYVDFVSVMYEELPLEFNNLTNIITGEEDGSINYLYTLIDEQITKIEVKYEERKRISLVKDLSNKIKNFQEFLMGLNDEIGNKEDITKKKIANFECKSDAEFLYKRLLK